MSHPTPFKQHFKIKLKKCNNNVEQKWNDFLTTCVTRIIIYIIQFAQL